MTRAALRALGAMLTLVALGAAAAPATVPALGRYAVELCVATAAEPPSCGPAQADLRSRRVLSVRVDDVIYHLELHSSQVEIVVMHNHVQIDGFTAPYEWVGGTLQFSDDDRHSRYEVRFPERPTTVKR